MSASVKRRRGRPRRDEPREISDFDLALIMEFQRRPAFYDRGHPHYRNREYLEPLWMEMAHNLGLNVGVVKNRIIQLRNRYNLEKRRVESLQERYNDPTIKSQWLLFEHLTFLSEHIKARRSFAKQILPLQPKHPPISNSSDSEECDASPPQFGNGNVSDSENHVAARDKSKSTMNGNVNSSDMDCVNYAKNVNLLDITNNNGAKFKAFGNFLASSLMEMNEKDALGLVEKFTSELVKSLMAEQAIQEGGQMNTSLSNISV